MRKGLCMFTLDTDRGPVSWECTLPPSAWGAAAFCKHHEIQLEPDGRALLRPGLATEAYFALLLQERCYADARRVLAHALRPRRSLWWGCLCAWDLYRPQPPAGVDQVRQAVVRFMQEPTQAVTPHADDVP